MKSLFTLFLAASLAAKADVVLSVPDVLPSADFFGSFPGFTRVLASSFTIGADYTDVEIKAHLGASFDGSQVTGFLMTQIGPGTTIANQIATGSGTTDISGDPLLSLISVPALSAGTYYLVLTSSSGQAYWSLSDNTLAFGAVGSNPGPGFSAASCDPSFGAGCGVDAYAPASNFTGQDPSNPTQPWHTYALEITGTPLDTAVPEPGYAAVAAGALVLAAIRVAVK